MEIIKYPDDLLRVECNAVEKVTPELVNTANEMYKTMREANGIGLAANQCGLDISLIVLEDDGKALVCFNPKIVEYSTDKEIKYEGCLSFSPKVCKVQRSLSIKVKFRNIHNKMEYKELSGLKARAFQHECDHLRGILLIDYRGKYE